MTLSSPRPPTRGDLALSRTLTGAAAVLAVVVAAMNLATVDDTAGGLAADAVTGFLALTFGFGLLALKARGDFILGLFGYWWPFMLPKSDEMARSIRQEAFGFSYLVILSAVLLVALPITMGAVLVDGFTAALAGLVPDVTASDAMALILATMVLLGVLPQAYLAWTLTPLEGDEDDKDGAESAA
ncbi:MAG: hypothetical protein RKE49_05985 [Oceanicaulis sp.]